MKLVGSTVRLDESRQGKLSLEQLAHFFLRVQPNGVF